MSAFLRHAKVRTLALARDPGALFYLLVGAASSLFIFPIMVTEFPVAGEERLVMQVIGLVLWPWLLSLAALVRVERSDAEPFPTEWPLPALPVGARARLLGEVAVLLLFLVVLRLPVGLLGEAGRELLAGAEPLWPEAPFGARVLAETARGALLFFPVLLAWSVPTRSKGWFFARPLTVVAILFAAIEAGLLHQPIVLAAVSLALSAAVILTVGWEPRLGARAGAGRGGPLRLDRPALAPEARFLRDRWSRPLLFYGAPVALGFLALLGVLILESRGALSRLAERGSLEADFIKGGSLGALIGLLPLPLLYPVGISLLKGVTGSRPGSLAPGGYAEAWSVLPVPPWKVSRAIYEHAFLGGVILWGLLMAYALLAYTMGVNSHRIVLYFLPLVLAVPCGSGLLVALAFGDNLRTGLSLTCLLLFVPLQIGAEYLAGRFPFHLLAVPDGPAARLSVCVILGLLLALVGGLPPLTYLRRDRAARGAAR